MLGVGIGAPFTLTTLDALVGSLFAGGVTQGAWYSPNRAISAPWYQDSIGTTPVTAVEQPVGLALDWSLGTAPELVVNGSLAVSTANWFAIGGAVTSTVNGAMRVQNGAANYGNAGQGVPTVVGKSYVAKGSVVGSGGGGDTNFCFQVPGTNYTAAQLASGIYFVATSTSTTITLQTGCTTLAGYVDFSNISIKAVGNYATQPTAASRPVLSSRVNLLIKTEQFDDFAWSKSAPTTLVVTTPNTSMGVDGTLTADTVTVLETQHSIQQNFAVMPGVSYTFSFYSKRGTLTDQKYSVYNVTGTVDIIAATSYYSQLNASTLSRVSVTFVAPAGCTSINVYILRDSGAIGNATFWGAQIDLGTTATRYQRVGSVNLLTKTEDFTDAAWVGYYVKPPITNGVLAPDGTLTATQFESADFSSPSPYSGIFQSGAIAANSGYVTVSVWARCVTGTLLLRLGIDDNYSVNNTLTTTWQRLTATFNVTTAPVNGRLLQMFESTLSNQAWQIWHPQCEFSATATPYQKADTPANNYDTAGFPSYLKFDGTQTSLSSATGGGGSAGFFFCAAVLITGGAGTVRTLFSDHNGSTSGYTLRVETNNQLTLYAGKGAGYSSASGPMPLVGIKYLVTGYDDGVNLVLELSGSAPTIVARPVVSAGLSNFSLGKYVGGETDFFKGQIYESVYARNTGLTPDQRLQIQRQVAAAAGITL